MNWKYMGAVYALYVMYLNKLLNVNVRNIVKTRL